MNTLRAFYDKALYAKANRLQVPDVKHGGRLKKSSSSSFLNISSDFVKKVDDMEQTVLIPTKLMDIEISDDPNAPQLILLTGNSNLYDVYQVSAFSSRLVH